MICFLNENILRRYLGELAKMKVELNRKSVSMRYLYEIRFLKVDIVTPISSHMLVVGQCQRAHGRCLCSFAN